MAYTDRLNDVWRVTLAMTTGTQQTQLTGLHYMITEQGTGDSRLSLIGDINTQFNTFIQAHLATTCSYYGSMISPVKTFAPYTPAITRVLIPGTNTPPMVPSQVRLLMKVKTDLVGRSYRGRMYGFSPGISEVAAGEHPSATYQTNWNNFGAFLCAPRVYNGTTWTAVLFHRSKKVGAIPEPTPITSITASGLWATQRRSGDYGRFNTSTPW